jgi:hypothetical protein
MITLTYQGRLRAQGASAKSRVEWAELKFPPINLYNVWPTDAMCRLHAERQDPLLWRDYDDNDSLQL